MISDRISKDIPPQMNSFQLECCKSYKAAHYPTVCDVINDVKLFLTVYRRIYCHKIFDVIQSDVVLQNQVH